MEKDLSAKIIHKLKTQTTHFEIIKKFLSKMQHVTCKHLMRVQVFRELSLRM
jgi:hypothetical protein